MSREQQWVARMRREIRPDTEWAEMAAVSQVTIHTWRRKHRIPARWERIRQAAVALIRQDPTVTDADWARRFGVCVETVGRWRRRARLAARSDRLQERVLEVLGDEPDVSDAEVARALGVSAPTVSRYRSRAGIPSGHRSRQDRERDELDGLMLDVIDDDWWAVDEVIGVTGETYTRVYTSLVRLCMDGRLARRRRPRDRRVMEYGRINAPDGREEEPWSR